MDKKMVYNESKYESIEDYLTFCKSGGCNALFTTTKHYQTLWEKGFLLPLYTQIRLMYGIGRGDEHYFVINHELLEGISANVHGGKEGLHNITDLLDYSKTKVRWELSGFFDKPKLKERDESLELVKIYLSENYEKDK